LKKDYEEVGTESNADGGEEDPNADPNDQNQADS